jgi:hypothetical protein
MSSLYGADIVASFASHALAKKVQWLHVISDKEV